MKKANFEELLETCIIFNIEYYDWTVSRQSRVDPPIMVTITESCMQYMLNRYQWQHISVLSKVIFWLHMCSYVQITIIHFKVTKSDMV
jgi:hypothetical protein